MSRLPNKENIMSLVIDFVMTCAYLAIVILFPNDHP